MLLELALNCIPFYPYMLGYVPPIVVIAPQLHVLGDFMSPQGKVCNPGGIKALATQLF